MAKVSFKSSDQGTGSGLYEGPVRISDARFGKSNFKGKGKFGEGVALLFNGEQLDENDDVVKEEYILSVGSNFLPSEDEDMPSEEGPYLVPKEGKEPKINAGCAFAHFSRTLEKVRGSEMTSAEDLNDLCIEIKRVPAPIPDNAKRTVVEVVGVLEAMPWDKPTAKKATTSPKAAKDDVVAEEQVTTGIDKGTLLAIMEVVVANATGKGIKLRDLPRAVDTVIKTWADLKERKNLLAQKTEILDEITGENFLTGKQDVFNYENDLVAAV